VSKAHNNGPISGFWFVVFLESLNKDPAMALPFPTFTSFWRHLAIIVHCPAVAFLTFIAFYLPSTTTKEVLDSVSSMSSRILMEDDGYWNIRHTHPISVRAVMSSSPQNERTTARDTLQHKRGDYWCCRVGGHCWTSTEVHADGVRRLPKMCQNVVHMVRRGEHYIERM
jgi:hypothetical protein